MKAPATSSPTGKQQGGPVVPEETYPGMILRPKLPEFVKLSAPPPARSRLPNTTNRKSAQRKTSPMTTPFYGAYWFFRVQDKTLPPDAIESRGDSTAISFRTTDPGELPDRRTPEAIARQRAGQQNAVLASRRQSRSRCRGADLSHPGRSFIRQFDEPVLRFELRLPRRNWSAKIAIDRLRLIP
jgi:hypothetical protein